MPKQNKELRTIGEAELQSRINELRKELVKVNAQVATGTIPKNPYQIKNSKRTIARILTIQRESELKNVSKVAPPVQKTAKPKTDQKNKTNRRTA